MTPEKLFQRMKENLEAIYKEDGIELDTYHQYLFERMKNLNDLWDFLKREEQIHNASAEDVYGLTLNLVVPECGIDTNGQLSDPYQKAVHNVEDCYTEAHIAKFHGLGQIDAWG